jgi:hypothetical protein
MPILVFVPPANVANGLTGTGWIARFPGPPSAPDFLRRRRARPEAPLENRDNFFPIIGIRANVKIARAFGRIGRAARRGRDEAKIGEEAIPGRATDNPLISLEMAKEKIWKSLEKFGNPGLTWTGYEFPHFATRSPCQTFSTGVARLRRTPSRRRHGSMNSRSFEPVNDLRPPETARA